MKSYRAFPRPGNLVNHGSNKAVVRLLHIAALFLLTMSTSAFDGCGGGSGSQPTAPATPTTASPTFNPSAGSFTSAQTVTIADSTAGATIYYTTNGSTPTTNSSIYATPIAIASTTTLEAMAVAGGYNNSAIATGTFTINLPAAATPSFSPGPGSYSSTQSVTLTDSTAGSSIYYTTDGSTPSTSSALYSAPIVVATSQTLKAIAAASGYANSAVASGSYTITAPTAAPAITTSAALAGARIVTLSDASSNATIYYSVDGSTPTISSQVYEAPFLVASNLTVNAIAVSAGLAPSGVSSQSFNLGIATGTLVWSDEFSNTSGANAQPNAEIWGYDTGNSGWGNAELEDYCAWGSNLSPCSASSPNAYVGTDGYLHVVAQYPSSGTYTSARLKTEGLFSFQYGRLEVRASLPEGQGLWPAIWLLGNNLSTVNWPACGEQDMVERVNSASTPDWNEGSVHGNGFTGSTGLGTNFDFPSGQNAAGWHTYGMIWKPGSVAYYVDDPSNPYVTYTPSSLSKLSGAVWPFDAGQSNFIIINVAVGGDWPGSPNASTIFPAEMQVDYVRIYTN